MEEKIALLHPEGKTGATIRRDKYEIIKDEIISIVNEEKEIAYKSLTEEINHRLVGKFEGSVTWYVTAVKLDLEARGIIKRFRKDRLQYLKPAGEAI